MKEIYATAEKKAIKKKIFLVLVMSLLLLTLAFSLFAGQAKASGNLEIIKHYNQLDYGSDGLNMRKIYAMDFDENGIMMLAERGWSDETARLLVTYTDGRLIQRAHINGNALVFYDYQNLFVGTPNKRLLQYWMKDGANGGYGLIGDWDLDFHVDAGAAKDRQGNIYVVSNDSKIIYKLTFSGNSIVNVELSASYEHIRYSGEIYGITIDEHDNLYAVEDGNKLKKWAPNGHLISEWSLPLPGPDARTTVAYYKGNLYVATASGGLIRVSPVSGRVLDTYDADDADYPWAIEVNPVTGQIHVALKKKDEQISIIRVFQDKGVTVTVTADTKKNPDTFTVTVRANDSSLPSPTGNVRLKIGLNEWTSSLVPDSGSTYSSSATFGPVALDPGEWKISAVYFGDSNFGSADSDESTLVVPTVSLASSQSVYDEGEEVELTASVSGTGPGGEAPSGTVTFKRANGDVIGSATLSGGEAVLKTDELEPGALHEITAEYEGDAIFHGQASNPVQVKVKAQTYVNITASDSPGVYGRSVTFTAEVTSASGSGSLTPEGTIKFEIPNGPGGTLSQTVQLADGKAEWTISSLPPGAYTLLAEYEGDGWFLPGSGSLPHIVDMAEVTVSVAPSKAATLFGETVKFTATVASKTSGTPSGSVMFKKGSEVIGTVTLSAGEASLEVDDLPVGEHDITATYSGDDYFLPGEYTWTSYRVDKAETSVKVEVSEASTAYGESVQLTATVTVNAPGKGDPTGQVIFMADGGEIGRSPLSGGVATLQWGEASPIVVGNYQITAQYLGDDSFAGSIASGAGAAQLDVQKAATQTNVTVTATVYGEAVTLMATVQPLSTVNTLPTGNVKFMHGTTELGEAPLAGGTATLSGIAGLAVGHYPITAVYGGDGSFLSSSGTGDLHVHKADTLTTVTASVYGNTMTFEALVTVVPPGSGTSTGTVKFMEGTTELGEAALNGGIAKWTIDYPMPGDYAITAHYSGDGSFNPSSGSNGQQVSRQASSVTVSASPAASVTGEKVTITTAVYSSDINYGIPTGTVTFKLGSVTLGTVSLTGGTVIMDTAALTAGTHTITAEYDGDSVFLPASGTVQVTVDKAGTAVQIAPSRTALTYGGSVALRVSVTVNAPGDGIPAGKITVYKGTQMLGEAALNQADGGEAEIVISRGLQVGQNEIYAEYEGDDRFYGSLSAPVTLTVNPPPDDPDPSPALPQPEETEQEPEPAPEEPPEVQFMDIRGHWAEPVILEAARQGIVSGYPDGTFHPNAPVTREEFAVMLANALKLEGDAEDLPFIDRGQFGEWARRMIALAMQAGIVRGYEDGSFRPRAYITRAEMAVMIAAALGIRAEAPDATGFRDDEDIPAWAKGAVESIRQLGIVIGRSEGRFVPHGLATRAEAVTIILKVQQ